MLIFRLFGVSCVAALLLSVVSGNVVAQQAAPAATNPTAGESVATPSASFSSPPEGILADGELYAGINVSRLCDSSMGKPVVLLAASLGLVGNIDDLDEFKAAVDLYSRISGLDLPEDIATVQVVVSSGTLLAADADKNPNNAMMKGGVLVVTFSGDAGNLEGIVLLAASYESTEIKGGTMHTGFLRMASPDKSTQPKDGKKPPVASPEPNKFALVITRPDGEGQGPVRAVFGLDQERVKTVAEGLVDASNTEVSEPRADFLTTEAILAEEGVIAVIGTHIDPLKVFGYDQNSISSTVLNNLTRIDARLAVQENDLVIDAILSVSDEKRSEQVRQLLQALVGYGIMHLEMGLTGSDPAGRQLSDKVAAVIESLRLSRKGKSVQVHGKVDEDLVLKHLGL